MATKEKIGFGGVNWRQVRYRLLALLPHTRWGDFLHGAPYYSWAHKRLPIRKRRLVADHFFWLKNSSLIEDSIVQFTSDKHDVKLFVGAVLGPGYVPETLALIREPEGLEGLRFDRDVVLKPTHLQGQIIFLKAGDTLPKADRAALAHCFTRNLYREHRERNYKNLAPKIIVEEALGDKEIINDYKAFCYKGEPRYWTVDQDRHTFHIRCAYTRDWERIPYWYEMPLGRPEDAPRQLQEMNEIARKLSAFFVSARIDLYLIEGRIFVGEITHCPASGAGRFESREAEEYYSRIFFGDEA